MSQGVSYVTVQVPYRAHICCLCSSRHSRSNKTIALVQARAKELRLELLNSQRLKAFFEEHPGETHSFGPNVTHAASSTAAIVETA